MKPIRVLKTYSQQAFVVAAFALMAFVGCFYVVGVVTEQNAILGENIIQNADLEIYKRFGPAENTLDNLLMVNSAEYWVFKDANDIEADLIMWSKQIAESSVSIAGYLTVYGYINGCYVDADSETWTPPEGWEPTKRPWYTGAMESGERFHYADFYIDEMTGERITSISKQVYSYEGKPIGVLAIDISAGYIGGFIDELTITNDGFGILLNAYNEILIHPDNNPDKNLEGMHISKLYPDYNGENVSGARYKDISGDAYILHSGEMFNGWRLLIVTPVTSYYKAVYTTAIVTICLAAVLSITLCLILTRLAHKADKSEYESLSKTSFLARISHEIRTPMNAIAGMSELILRKDVSPDVYDHAVNIKNASDNLLAIVNDILDYSKLESGNLAIAAAEYQFSSLMNDVTGIIRMRLQDKPIRFVSNVDCAVPSVLIGDEARIRQVLLNVLSNAAKYTTEGFVSIAVMVNLDKDKKTAELIFEIEDSGVGIKEENLHKIFGDFVRADFDDGRVIKGTGLGLAITKSLCEAMGGSITVHSKYGEGSVFTVKIPQRFNTYVKFATVDNAADKAVLVYEPRVVYANSLVCAVDNLGCPVTMATGESMFYNELSQNKYKYVFAASSLYDSAMDIIKRLMLSTTLVLVCEPRDAVNSARDIRAVSMPASPLTISDVLNDTTQSLAYNFGKEATIGFIAPKARILIVDDIQTNLQVAEGLMAPYKMKIDTALSGKEAIEMVKKNIYNIVFMDHMMPEMDGIETTTLIRAIEDETDFYKKLPIVALTANAMAGMKEKFIQSGMDDFLAKPIELSKLNAVLETWIPRNMMERYVKGADGQTDDEIEINIPGLDTKRGLAMSGGLWKNYEKTLTIYYYDAKQRIDDMRRKLEEGDINAYVTIVHALKSASGSIGAIELSKTAAALEEAVKAGDMNYISENNDKFINMLEELVNAIESAMFTSFGDETDNENDIPYLHEILDNLKSALDEMNMTAIDELMSKLDSGMWDKELKTQVENISKYVLLFEYDNAIGVIDDIIKKYIE